MQSHVHVWRKRRGKVIIGFGDFINGNFTGLLMLVGEGD